jgi:Tol biopolymer transport system component
MVDRDAATPGGRSMRIRVGERGGALIGTCGFVLALMLIAAPSAAMGTTNPYRNKIVYVNSGDLWTCNPSGTGQHRITSGAAVDSSPRWSANHRRVYFLRQDGTRSSIRSVVAGGGKTTQVAHTAVESGVWAYTSLGVSGNGKTLYFGDGRGGYADQTEYHARLVSMNLRTGRKHVLARDLEGYDIRGVAPDGKHVLSLFFGSEAGPVTSIRVSDGKYLRYGDYGRTSAGAAWSPDGSRIAFSTFGHEPDYVALMKTSGTITRTLMSWSATPAWYEVRSYSPSGKSLLITRWDSDAMKLDLCELVISSGSLRTIGSAGDSWASGDAMWR